jgi:protein O-GlcNAc transferase
MNFIIPEIREIEIQINQAIQWHRQGQLEKAEKTYRKIIAYHPNHAGVLNLLGLIEYQKNNFEYASFLISQAIRIEDKNPDFHNNLGTVYKTMGKLSKARNSYMTALNLKPDSANTAYNIGGVYLVMGDVEQAIKYYQRTLSINYNFYQVYTNLSAIYNQLKRYNQALKYAQQGLQYLPNNAALLNNMGNALKGTGKFKQAKSAYEKSIKIDPDSTDGYINLGNILNELGEFKAAIKCYEDALNLDPNSSEVYNNLGTVLKALGHFNDAIVCYQKAIQLNPQDAFPYHNLGNIFMDLGEKKKAIKCLSKAITINPKLVEAHISMGIALQYSGKGIKAVDSFMRAISINPDHSKSYCQLVRTLQHECRWEELKHYGSILDDFTKAALESGQKPDEVPFLHISRHSNPYQNYKVAKAWSDYLIRHIKHERKEFQDSCYKKSRVSKKITIGYLSNNFKNHPTAHLIGGLFKYHNRERFNVYCYSYGIKDNSLYRQQIENECDRFIDITSDHHVEAAKQICSDEVDILVDLVGHMRSNRLEIPALRPAPLQVRWLGMAGTSGADFIDYIITDRIVTPEDQVNFYTEKFAYMPDTYQINNNKPAVSIKKYDRKDFGLPEDMFIYASFCSTYKIDSIIYGTWMTILKQVPRSILWLLGPSPSAQERLKTEAKNCGIDPNRIIFAKKINRSEHLARVCFADLCLDTRIVNGAATTSDALWAGVPVLTILGEHFASRMAASILAAMDLPELIAPTLNRYEKLAVQFGKETDLYNETRKKVNMKKTTAALFDTLKFVKHLENIFQQMWNNYTTGKKRDILKVTK